MKYSTVTNPVFSLTLAATSTPTRKGFVSNVGIHGQWKENPMALRMQNRNIETSGLIDDAMAVSERHGSIYSPPQASLALELVKEESVAVAAAAAAAAILGIMSTTD